MDKPSGSDGKGDGFDAIRGDGRLFAMIRKDDIVLFQGDSITDAGRDRTVTEANAPQALGRGYAFHAAAMLLARYPGGTMKTYNKGVSGNRITNMIDRWQEDALLLQPTVISILIGVNDTWHGTAKGTPENGVGLDHYEQAYRKLIDDTRAALPGVRFVLCEPFTTRAGAVLQLNFFPEIDERRRIVRQIASDTGSTLVTFQDAFDEACKQAPPDYWAGDGVHPSMAGHMLMARTWVRTVCG
jgi:lysophospholipase L1-like esterase